MKHISTELPYSGANSEALEYSFLAILSAFKYRNVFNCFLNVSNDLQILMLTGREFHKVGPEITILCVSNSDQGLRIMGNNRCIRECT